MQEQKPTMNRKHNSSKPAALRTAGTSRQTAPQRTTGKTRPQSTAGRTHAATPRQPLSNDERRRLRAERARKKRQRRNRILALILTGVVFVVGTILCLTVFFHVRSVGVEGQSVYDAEAIIKTSGIDVGENMFLIRSKKVAENIQHDLPYIESVKIKRKLSGDMQLLVQAASATAAIESDAQYILISDKGKVLETGVTELPEHVMQLQDCEIQSATPGETIVFAQEASMEIFETMMQVLAENDFQESVTAIRLGDKGQVYFTYDNRIQVKVGALQDAAEKMDFIKAALLRNDEKTPDFRGEIDFSIDKKAFLHPEEETKKPTETTVPETTTVA